MQECQTLYGNVKKSYLYILYNIDTLFFKILVTLKTYLICFLRRPRPQIDAKITNMIIMKIAKFSSKIVLNCT